MTNNGYRSGGQASAQIAYEDPDVWGQDADSMTASGETYFAAGQGIEVGLTKSNNKIRNFGVGQRNAASTSILGFSGTLTLGGAVTSFYWLLGALGSNADAGSGPSSYTHTYTESDSLPSFSAKLPIVFNTEKYELIQGAVTNQLTLTSAINEVTKFSMECPFRYSSIETGSTSVAADTQAVYTFAGGSIEIPDGTTIAAVQNFELTIRNNAELVPEVGSRFAAGYAAKNREYDFKFTAAVTDFSLVGLTYAGTTGATAPGTGNGSIGTMTLNFTNADGHTAVFTLPNCHFNEDVLPRNINDIVKEDITGWCDSLTNVVYTNATETAPIESTNV